jgi:5'-3' exoribonuclease 1
VYKLPELTTRFVPALCQGVRLGKELIEGYGSLSTHEADFAPVFEVGAVSIFGRPSRKESLLLGFQEGDAQTTDDVMHLLGQEVWINYPHLKRGRVCCIVDRRKRISAQWDKDGNFMNHLSEMLTAEEYRQFKKETELHQQFLKAKCGIILPNIDVLVYVNRFVGMRISRKGKFLHQWSRRDTCYPLQLVTGNEAVDMVEDPRYQERERAAGDFETGKQVLYLGPDPKGHRGESATGAIGFVIETQRAGNSADDFSTLVTRQFLKPQPVPKRLIKAAESDNWLSLGEVTDQIRSKLHISLSAFAVTQICSSIVTSPQWGSNELGLCMKFTTKNLARVGLAKLVATQYNPWYVGNSNLFETMEQSEGGHYLDTATAKDRGGRGGGGPASPNPQSQNTASGEKGQWFFSLEARDIIAEYCQKFLPFVQRIVAGGHNGMQFDMASVLTGPWAERDPDEIMHMMVAWLEEKGLHHLPMISATDDAFTKDVVGELEESLIATTPRPTQELKLRRVLSRHIHYPSARAADGSVVPVPLPARDQKYGLGNRVVYARTTGIVPFGSTGTIVRLLGDGKTADVVFDEPFVGGSVLGGRLKTTRGALCRIAALLVTSAKPTAIFDPTAPERIILASTGKPFVDFHADASEESPKLKMEPPQKQPKQNPQTASPQQQQPAVVPIVPKPTEAPKAVMQRPQAQQQQYQQPPQQQPQQQPRHQHEQWQSPVPAAESVPAPASRAAAAGPARWNAAPQRLTPVSVRNNFMSKVHTLLNAKFAQKPQQ